MDRLSAMQAYVRVVEAGTFTKAADSLDLPKATVTRLIQTLETHLRTKLLNRTTRRVTVTPDGAAYYERAMRLLSDLDELEGSMNQARMTPRGRIRIDVPGVVGREMIIPHLPDFYAKYPDIQIELGVSDRTVDLISDNIDCVIRGGELTDQSLVARRLQHFCVTVESRLEFTPEHFTQSAGLICYYDTRTHFYLRVSHLEGQGKILGIVLTDDGVYDELPSIAINDWKQIYLRAEIDRDLGVQRNTWRAAIAQVEPRVAGARLALLRAPGACFALELHADVVG